MDFIYNLYQSDNFILYLTIALVVLVILFVVVFFFGKKDQKSEETKRLQKIELDNAFKEEKKELEKVEVKNTEVEEKEESKEELIKEQKEENIELPKEKIFEKKSIFDETQSLPIVEDETQKVNVIEFEPDIKEEKNDDVILTNDKDKPLLGVEEKPLFANDFDDIEKDLNELASLKQQIDEVGLKEDKKPETKEIEEKKFKPSPVFSSVFVNKPEEKEENTESDKKVPLFTIEDDADMELPALKKDTVDEEVKLDNITGETYEIKR